MSIFDSLRASYDRQIAELQVRATQLRSIGDTRTAQGCEEEAERLRRVKNLIEKENGK